MRKSQWPFGDLGATLAFEDWGAATCRDAFSVRTGPDMVFHDDGGPFPLAATPSSSSASASGAKPVATIAQLADYLINGFWQYYNTTAHHWSSNTITYNISGLNESEQFLALSALQAWH